MQETNHISMSQCNYCCKWHAAMITLRLSNEKYDIYIIECALQIIIWINYTAVNFVVVNWGVSLGDILC